MGESDRRSTTHACYTRDKHTVKHAGRDEVLDGRERAPDARQTRRAQRGAAWQGSHDHGRQRRAAPRDHGRLHHLVDRDREHENVRDLDQLLRKEGAIVD